MREGEFTRNSVEVRFIPGSVAKRAAKSVNGSFDPHDTDQVQIDGLARDGTAFSTGPNIIAL